MARRTERRLAGTIQKRIVRLAALSSRTDRLVRTYLSAEHKSAADLVSTWMTAAGLTVSVDAAGTVVGRLEGQADGARTLLLGSHLDTVHNAGRYDGALGVLVAIAAIAELKRARRKLPFAVEVLAFGDVEGVRFGQTLTGSRAIAGVLEPGVLNATDGEGITMRSALATFGSKPEAMYDLARDTAGLLGFVEVHIEQGPMLEQEKLPVGVVTAISGACRFMVDVTGIAGHAGTVPMAMRRDALAAAAEMVLSVETMARNTPGIVATVGRLSVAPDAINVVAGEARFSLDVRSPVDGTRRSAVRRIQRDLKAIARRRSVGVRVQEIYEARAAACDQRFIRHFSQAIERAGHSAFGLPSNAGHDGLAMVHLCPIGMLFVRCKGGISHHPDEFVTIDDIETATRVLVDFLDHVSRNGHSVA